MSIPHAFFFNDTATTEIYTLSLHDALPICIGMHQDGAAGLAVPSGASDFLVVSLQAPRQSGVNRSEEHTSELQSHLNLVCRLLLEKKKHDQLSIPKPPVPRTTRSDRASTYA